MDEVRKRIGAPVVLTLDYGLTGWLAFYLPSHPPVEQINERMCYVNAPEPDPALFRRHHHVCVHGRVRRILPNLRKRFTTVEPVADLERGRGTACDLQDYQRLQFVRVRSDRRLIRRSKFAP